MSDALALHAEDYHLLALGLRYPDLAVLRSQWPTLGEIREERGSLRELAALGLFLDEELAGEHNRLFATRVAVSPYETAWVPLDKGARLGQLAALYEAFGVRAGGAEHETPDHIGAQLEFFALLCLKEILAEEDQQREDCRRGRRILMEEHLGRWAPAFGRALARESLHPFYRGIGERIVTVLEADLRELGVMADPVDGPQVEGEAHMTCPMHGREEEDSPAFTLPT